MGRGLCPAPRGKGRTMARKRTALQQAQRRAKAKVRSLRARGATASELAATPVLSWSEVQRLTPAQRGGYYQKLKSFSKTRMSVLQNGDIVRESLLLKIKRDARAINRQAQAEARRIDAIRINGGVEGAGNITTIAQRQAESRLTDATGKSHYVRGTVYGSLTNIQMTERPYSRASAAYTAEVMARAAKMTFEQRRRKLRESAADMLRRIGDDDTARAIERMSDDEFDVLTQRTVFMDALALAYSPAAGTKDEGLSPKEAARRIEEQGSTVNLDYLDYVRVVLAAVR